MVAAAAAIIVLGAGLKKASVELVASSIDSDDAVVATTKATARGWGCATAALVVMPALKPLPPTCAVRGWRERCAKAHDDDGVVRGKMTRNWLRMLFLCGGPIENVPRDASCCVWAAA